MKLLCLIEAPNDGVAHIVDEIQDSGVFAICGNKTTNGSYWRVALREPAGVACDRCRGLIGNDELGEFELVLKMPGGAYDVLRTMITSSRSVTVVVPAGMSPEERQKAIGELASISDILGKM